MITRSSVSVTVPAPERTRLSTELQQLYADGKHTEILAQVEVCLPKDEAGNFIPEQERSDVVHDQARLPCGEDAGDE